MRVFMSGSMWCKFKWKIKDEWSIKESSCIAFADSLQDFWYMFMERHRFQMWNWMRFWFLQHYSCCWEGTVSGSTVDEVDVISNKPNKQNSLLSWSLYIEVRERKQIAYTKQFLCYVIQIAEGTHMNMGNRIRNVSGRLLTSCVRFIDKIFI